MADIRNPGTRRSIYTYDRNIVADIARELAAARQRATYNWQLELIDGLGHQLADMFAEHDASFDADTFCSTARLHQGLAPLTHTQTKESTT